MKVFVAVLLISFSTFSQGGLVIDTALEPYVESYVKEASKRGYNIRGLLIHKLDYIRLLDTINIGSRDEVIGVVGRDGRGFFVSAKILKDTMKTKTTVFHEIGHVLTKSGVHTCIDCSEIMSSSYPKDTKIMEIEGVWSKVVDNYFNWLASNFRE